MTATDTAHHDRRNLPAYRQTRQCLAGAWVTAHDNPPSGFAKTERIGSYGPLAHVLAEVNRRHKTVELLRQFAIKLGGRQPIEQKKNIWGKVKKSKGKG